MVQRAVVLLISACGLLLPAGAGAATARTGSTGSFTTTGSDGGASGTATTGNATSITSTSAMLNGLANPDSADSGWAFQYGTSPDYSELTPVQVIGTGVRSVSIEVTGLRPGTTYHFRLVVNEGTYPRTNVFGGDRTFTTLSTSGAKKRFGRASLASRRLIVHRGRVRITIECADVSNTWCKGRVSVTARGKIGARARTVGCGTARFNLRAGTMKRLRPRISHGCAALLAAAHHHRRGANLKATFSTHQTKLKRKVTLILR